MSFGFDNLFFILEHSLIGWKHMLDKELRGSLLLILPLPGFEFFSDEINEFGLLIQQRSFQDLLVQLFLPVQSLISPSLSTCFINNAIVK